MNLTAILNSIVWTTQDASEARQATTLPVGDPWSVLDPSAAPIRRFQEALYALHLTGGRITQIHLEKQ